MGDATFKEKTNGFPTRALQSAEANVYRGFESNLLACGKGVVLSDLEAASRAALLKAFDYPVLPGYQALDVTSVPAFATLDAELLAVGSLFEKRDAVATATRQAAARAGLGYYTTEQEADELSAEWLALIGIDPKAALEGQFLFGRDIEKTVGNNLVTEIPLAECRTLLDR